MFKSILTTNEEAEYIRKNHPENHSEVKTASEGFYISRMTGPSSILERINSALNIEGPNKKMTYAELLKIDIAELQAFHQAKLEETADEPEPFYIEFEL